MYLLRSLAYQSVFISVINLFLKSFYHMCMNITYVAISIFVLYMLFI